MFIAENIGKKKTIFEKGSNVETNFWKKTIMMKIAKNKNVGEKFWKKKELQNKSYRRKREQNLYTKLNKKGKKGSGGVAVSRIRRGKTPAPTAASPQAMVVALTAAPVAASARCCS